MNAWLMALAARKSHNAVVTIAIPLLFDDRLTGVRLIIKGH